MKILPSKFTGETITVTWDFLGKVPFGQTISSPVISVVLVSGTDSLPAEMLSGSASVVNSTVTQKITLGVPGCIYALKCVVTAAGNTYEDEMLLAVLSNLGDAAAPLAQLSLTGTLPGGFIGVPYSNTLQISGGVSPYITIRIISGSMPAWMSAGIVGSQVVFSGTPDTVAVSTFTPEVIDYAGFRASDPQVVSFINSLAISGDLVNGIIGDVISYPYTISGGVPAYTASISAGSLPTGTTLSSAGVVTGTYSATGNFSWTVHAVDSGSNTANLADSNTVYNYPALLTSTHRYDGPPTSLSLNGTVPFSVGAVNTMTASIDGTYVALVGSSGPPYLQIAKFSGGTYSLLPDNPAYPAEATRGVDISPDGVWLATASASGAVGTLRVYKRTGDTFNLTDTKTGSETFGCAWSPDGTKLAWTQRESSPQYGVESYTLNTGSGTLGSQKRGRSPGLGFTGGSFISWSPSGSYVAIGGTIILGVYDMTASSDIPVAASFTTSPTFTDTNNGAHWSSNGAFLYTVGTNYTAGAIVSVFSFSGSALTRLTNPSQPSGTGASDSSITIRRDYLAVGQSGDAGNSIYLYSLSGSTMTPITPLLVTPTDTTLVLTWSKIS